MVAESNHDRGTEANLPIKRLLPILLILSAWQYSLPPGFSCSEGPGFYQSTGSLLPEHIPSYPLKINSFEIFYRKIHL